MVPTFAMIRLMGSVPNSAPAASPRVRRRLSPWPPGRGVEPDVGVAHVKWACAAIQPMSARFGVGDST
jgi:hypothetical protein